MDCMLLISKFPFTTVMSWIETEPHRHRGALIIGESIKVSLGEGCLLIFIPTSFFPSFPSHRMVFKSLLVCQCEWYWGMISQATKIFTWVGQATKPQKGNHQCAPNKPPYLYLQRQLKCKCSGENAGNNKWERQCLTLPIPIAVFFFPQPVLLPILEFSWWGKNELKWVQCRGKSVSRKRVNSPYPLTPCHMYLPLPPHKGWESLVVLIIQHPYY